MGTTGKQRVFAPYASIGEQWGGGEQRGLGWFAPLLPLAPQTMGREQRTHRNGHILFAPLLPSGREEEQGGRNVGGLAVVASPSDASPSPYDGHDTPFVGEPSVALHFPLGSQQ